MDCSPFFANFSGLGETFPRFPPPGAASVEHYFVCVGSSLPKPYSKCAYASGYPSIALVYHSAMPTKGTRTGPMREMMHFCIDFAGRRYPQATLTRVKPKSPMRQYNCTMGNKRIYIMEIPQSQTECSLYNSISGATDYCTL